MSEMKKCPSCDSTNLSTKVENYHFLESGLNNVYLVDAEVLECKDCGEKLVPIFRPFELMDCLAKDIIQKDTLLTGPEIRFLRKNLGMKIADLADLLDVDRVTVSRWENGHEHPSKAHDKLIRLAYDSRKGMDEKAKRKIWTRKEASHLETNYLITPPRDEQPCVVGHAE